MKFNFQFPQKIIFENGISEKLGSIVKDICVKPLIITSGNFLKESGNFEKIINSFIKENIEFIEYSTTIGEPTPELIDEVTGFANKKEIKCIIAIGGGSVIDTGKAVSAMVVNKKGIENYLEGVGKDFKIINQPLPFIAVPTTAGSGAEATKNSVIASRKKKYKKSFRDDRLLAKIIIVDPLLTLSLPKKETAYGGMDAICQLIESYVSKKKNIYCLSLSSYFIPKALKAITKAYDDPGDIDARSIMIASSLISGLCLANSGLGAVHGFASGIGGMFDISHGLICAVLLPGVCNKNSSRIPLVYKDLAQLINSDGSDDINKFIDCLYEINNKLNIPCDFKEYSISKDNANEVVERSKGSSMSGNPVDFTDQEWVEFIKEYLPDH
jgi:alcohol dehydrogenase class IV